MRKEFRLLERRRADISQIRFWGDRMLTPEECDKIAPDVEWTAPKRRKTDKWWYKLAARVLTFGNH
jgi:hypothetical protein